MVAAFLALSAFFHFFISSPAMFTKYSTGLKKHINVFRWVEYSLSSSIMIIVIMQLNGTADYIALLGIFGVNVCMILFGWLQEKYTTPGDGDLLPFWFGCIAGSIPWIAAVINLISPKGPAEASPPGFVYGIVISLFLMFNCFAIVQYKQYKAQGKWSNYLRGERAYNRAQPRRKIVARLAGFCGDPCFVIKQNEGGSSTRRRSMSGVPAIA
ncbi:hypothetical protein EMGBS4_08830 [Acidimicrobiaceae bacterium]|nr:hypothetical protein EMGBS4_08830 [Acidimicrobiaceae bacterium]